MPSALQDRVNRYIAQLTPQRCCWCGSKDIYVARVHHSSSLEYRCTDCEKRTFATALRPVDQLSLLHDIRSAMLQPGLF